MLCWTEYKVRRLLPDAERMGNGLGLALAGETDKTHHTLAYLRTGLLRIRSCGLAAR